MSAGNIWCLKGFAACFGVTLDVSPHSCLDHSAAQTSGKEPSPAGAEPSRDAPGKPKICAQIQQREAEGDLKQLLETLGKIL